MGGLQRLEGNEGIDMNKCVKCGLNFRSVSAFDEHRVGNFKNFGANRRCLTPEELNKIGMVEIDGAWRRPMPADLVAKLYGEKQASLSSVGGIGTPSPIKRPVAGTVTSERHR